MSAGKLFVVATPIGNLSDLSARAIETLRQVKAVACEDTRVSRKIFSHIGAAPELISYHQYSSEAAVERIRSRLAVGDDVALVTDAGTPGISDPGGRLVEALAQDFEIVPIPGASAVTAILSVAGLPADRFLFLAYPPHKKGRAKYFARVAESPDTVVFYESPHRIGKTLKQLATACKDAPARRLVVGRELTKMFETIYRGQVGEAETLVPEKDFRGEFVIVIEGSK